MAPPLSSQLVVFELIIEYLDRLLLPASHSVGTCVGSIFFWFRMLHFRGVENSAVAYIAVIIVIVADSGIFLAALKNIPQTMRFFLSVDLGDGEPFVSGGDIRETYALGIIC
jgi:hypothetical protein